MYDCVVLQVGVLVEVQLDVGEWVCGVVSSAGSGFIYCKDAGELKCL